MRLVLVPFIFFIDIEMFLKESEKCLKKEVTCDRITSREPRWLRGSL